MFALTFRPALVAAIAAASIVPTSSALAQDRRVPVAWVGGDLLLSTPDMPEVSAGGRVEVTLTTTPRMSFRVVGTVAREVAIIEGQVCTGTVTSNNCSSNQPTRVIGMSTLSAELAGPCGNGGAAAQWCSTVGLGMAGFKVRWYNGIVADSLLRPTSLIVSIGRERVSRGRGRTKVSIRLMGIVDAIGHGQIAVIGGFGAGIGTRRTP